MTKAQSVAKIEPVQTAPVAQNTGGESVALMDMIQRAARDPSISIERVEQMYSFYERVQAAQARRAFDAAMSAAKAEIPVILKNRHVSYGEDKKKTEYDHEDLAGIASVVDPILSRHGLSYRYRVSSNLNEPVKVTCVVSHADGYFEETTLSAGRDDSGGKNAIQSIGSTLTYLQRYSLKAALGIAAAKDDDGENAGKTIDEVAQISAEQAEILSALITETKTNVSTFLKIAQAGSVGAILSKDYEGLKKLLTAKKANT